MSTFGEIVRDRRSALSMTQTSLAELVGETTSVVRSWEREQAIPGDPNTLQTLSTVLGVDIEVLLVPAKEAGYVVPAAEISPGVRQLGYGSSLQRSQGDETEVFSPVEPELEPTQVEEASQESVELEQVPGPSVETVDQEEPDQTAAVEPAAMTRQAPARPPANTQVSAIRRIGKKKPSQAANYLDDATELRNYRLRALYTTAGVVALLIVGRYALAEAVASVSSMWSTFSENFRF